jgi:FkbM family methyltransferase
MRYFPNWLLKNRYLNKACRILNGSYRMFLQAQLPASVFKLEKLGSEYGGWYVPVSEIESNWVVYSAGILQDITFDWCVIRKFGCKVYAFDPTPEAISFVTEKRNQEEELGNLIFMPVGLWNANAKLKFFSPRSRGWIGSYSIHNLQGTDSYFEAYCKTLPTIMSELGHRKINLLKLDIEGAEYEVLDNLLETKTEVDWLCVEFDQPVPVWTTHRMLSRLRSCGFQLQQVDHWNFTFAHWRVLQKRQLPTD